MRNKAEKLVLKYFNMLCKNDIESYDVLKMWAENANYYKHFFHLAIQCAILETEAVIDKLERIGISTYRHKMLLAELKTLF
jgi:hypothetical protein